VLTDSHDRRFRVAVLLDLSRHRGRGIARGIAQAARDRYDWSTYFHVGEIGDALPSWFQRWEGDGVIARMEHPGIVPSIVDKGIPVVDVRGAVPVEGIPIVRTDDAGVANLAVGHLMECEFRRFAFCGYAGADFSDRRCQAMETLIQKSGDEFHVFSPKTKRKKKPNIRGHRDLAYRGLVDDDELVTWLKALPKPIGVLACDDVRAQQIVNVCRGFDIAVPDQVAVIGVGNCDVLCGLSEPPLTSIEHDTVGISQFAVHFLEQMMEGGAPTELLKLVEPKRLVTRQSTDVLAIEDQDIILAAQYIRENACKGINVQDVLRAVPLSRRELERRYLKTLRRTPKEDILRVRVSHIKKLLLLTDLPIYGVAQESGFDSADYMCTVFKKRTGLTPTQYREQQQKIDLSD